MRISLPSWVVDNATSVEAEAAPWRGVSVRARNYARRDPPPAVDD